MVLFITRASDSIKLHYPLSVCLQVIITHGGSYDATVLDMVDVALIKSLLHERRGDLQQHLGHSAEALKCYKKSNAYR